MTKTRRSALRALSCCAAFAALSLGAFAAGVRLNVTESQPLGFYLATDAPIERGTLVAVCLDPSVPAVRFAQFRRYFPSGNCPGGMAPSLKQVAALPGDTVGYDGGAVVINGHAVPNSARLDRDPYGVPLPHNLPGRTTVPAGQVLLLATRNPLSYDGRYYGLMPMQGVRYAMRPLWLL